MSVFWRNVKRGQNLMMDDTAGLEEVIGGYRENKSGISAYARTMGYEPERSRKGFDSVEDAKAFVESLILGTSLVPGTPSLKSRPGRWRNKLQSIPTTRKERLCHACLLL